MKNCLLIFTLLCSSLLFSQNILVDSSTYTPQQLIEDILVDSDCITNVTVTNVIGGDFGGTDQSYGYFDASGTTFPMQSGIVMGTGRLNNVPGPNTSLSDDDAPSWDGDAELETVLGESNTHNATIIEFDFESLSDQISFKYLFASEEYQEDNSNTCNYSDLFGFLIRPVGTSEYDNIAIVPGTSTPVKVTTVHPGVPGSCDPINEDFFDTYNDLVAPINFNGQTVVLTATATVIPNETYHVKLVIADEQNYRYDSAVFLEAGSFLPTINLGNNRLLATRNPLCENETLILDATQSEAIGYTWLKNGIPIGGETNPIYTVENPGIYSVEVNYPGTCFASGEVIVEYSLNPIVNNTVLINCDFDLDGITFYNLFDAENDVVSSTEGFISDFYNSLIEATEDMNAIPDADIYENTSVGQTVFARVENDFGCFSIAEVSLDFVNNTINIPPFRVCDDYPLDGFSDFDLNQLRTQIEALVPIGSTITFYQSELDLITDTDSIDGIYSNTIQDSEVIYVLITNASVCYAISTVILTMEYTPDILDDETFNYCLSNFPETITLDAGVLSGFPDDFSYQWFLDGTPTPFTTETININEPGNYNIIATHTSGCSATRDIIVQGIETVVIDDISVEGDSPNNSVTISVIGNSEYEYALDNENGFYQDSNVFTNVSVGEHIVYVRDINGCGNAQEVIYVLGFPSFFTPNGDEFNETWKPVGVDPRFRSTMIIHIYNRYGKLIKQVNPNGSGWNGTLNGENLSVDDYWYVVTFLDGKEYRGHFALVR